MSKKQSINVTVYETDDRGRTRVISHRRQLRWRPASEPRPDGKVRPIKRSQRKAA